MFLPTPRKLHVCFDGFSFSAVVLFAAGGMRYYFLCFSNNILLLLLFPHYSFQLLPLLGPVVVAKLFDRSSVFVVGS